MRMRLKLECRPPTRQTACDFGPTISDVDVLKSILIKPLAVVTLVLAVAIAPTALGQSTTGHQSNRAHLEDLLRRQGVEMAQPSTAEGGETSEYREFTVGFGLAGSTGPDGRAPIQGRGLRVLNEVRGSGMPKQRMFSLTGGKLVAVGIDGSGLARALRLIRDPRSGVSEDFGDDGVLRASIPLDEPNAEFSLVLPVDPSIVELRVYEPQWSNESVVSLRLLGAVTVENPDSTREK